MVYLELLLKQLDFSGLISLKQRNEFGLNLYKNTLLEMKAQVQIYCNAIFADSKILLTRAFVTIISIFPCICHFVTFLLREENNCFLTKTCILHGFPRTMKIRNQRMPCCGVLPMKSSLIKTRPHVYLIPRHAQLPRAVANCKLVDTVSADEYS